MKDLRYLGSATGEFVGDLNDIHIVTDADWVAAETAALLRGADPILVAEAMAARAHSPSELLGLSAVGDIQYIDKSDRLKQDITKILITERGLMPYPNYGTLLPLLPATSPTDVNLLPTLSDDIIVAMRYLDLIETSTEDDERIGEITTLDLEFQNSTIAITLNYDTLARTLANIRLEI